jgi:hypothetical protein
MCSVARAMAMSGPPRLCKRALEIGAPGRVGEDPIFYSRVLAQYSSRSVSHTIAAAMTSHRVQNSIDRIRKQGLNKKRCRMGANIQREGSERFPRVMSHRLLLDSVNMSLRCVGQEP